MPLTVNERAAMESAIADAEREVLRLDAIARESSAFPGWFFPTDEQRVASAGRAVLVAIREVRDAAIATGDHEEALRVVENARRLARVGSTAKAIEGNTVGDKVSEIVESLPNVVPSASWLKLAIVVVGLVALASVLGYVSTPLKALKGTR